MLRQLLVGSGVSICNIVIHALVMTALVRVLQTVSARKTSRPAVRLISVMVATVSVNVENAFGGGRRGIDHRPHWPAQRSPLPLSTGLARLWLPG